MAFFILMIGDYPFTKASKADPKYQHIYKKDPFMFWKKNSRAKKKINKGLISGELIDLLTNMLLPSPDSRFSIEQIKEHPWYLEPSMEISKVKDYMESIRLQKGLKQ